MTPRCRSGLLPGLLLVCFTLLLSTRAEAGDHFQNQWVSHDPSAGYAVPIQRTYQFPASIVFQPGPPDGYAVPLQHVWRFPASLVFQPGPEPRFGGVFHSSYDQYGGPSFIPR